jgi:AGZA family xanthine/uracil permease-like MFS transporter
VLVLVGAVMFSELQAIDYSDPAIRFSTFFTVMGMPLTYSITDGLLLGALVYVAVRFMQRKIKENGGMRLLAAVGVVLYFFL